METNLQESTYLPEATHASLLVLPGSAKAQKMTGMDLTALSLDTVKMFAVDAKAAGFSL